MKKKPKNQNLPPSAENESKRKGTSNSKKEDTSQNKSFEKTERHSNSFCHDKKSPEEKIMNLKEIINSKQNKLYEALSTEFKLKENMIGLEKHALKLELENKILHQNRRQSVSTQSVIQQVVNELNNLKKENIQLFSEAKQVREGAIDALVEKEKKIIELSDEIQNREQFYKIQFDQAREEIKLMQGKIKSDDLMGILSIEKQKTLDLENNLEFERKELMKRIYMLEETLEEKERENKQNLVNLENNLNEANENRFQEHMKLIERDYKIYKNSLNILEKAEEKSDHYEIYCFNLQEKLKGVEVEHSKEIEKYKQKLEEIRFNQKEILENVKKNYEKQIEDCKTESQKSLTKKNEYIMQQEKSKDNLINRILDLEKDNKKKLIENNKLIDSVHYLTQQNISIQNRLEEVASKQEEYINDLKKNFNYENQILTFELKHVKKLAMDDSSLMNPKTKVRKSSFDINENQKHQKRNSLALRSIIPKNLGHSPSLGLEFSNKNDIFMFKNNVSHIRNSIIKSVLSNQNEKNPIEELEGEKELINGNFSYSFDYNQKSKSNIIDSKMLFSIPKEPMEHEGIIKANEQSSESDISGLSSKICCEKGVQANMENESCFEKIQDINKNDIFLQDFEMHNDKKNNPQTEKNQVKKTSIKINSKFFLIGDDSDDSQIFKKGKLEKSNNESIMNVIKSKSEKQSFVDKNSRKFYLDEIENKISGLSNLINDFLRNFKEKKQTGEVFNASKKNKFLKIHHSLNDLMKKLNFDHYVMKHELLKKTMIKLDEETLKTLNYHKLMTLIFEGYSRLNEGFIEYNLNLNDGIMKKVWKFQIRYSKLRNFHKECKSFLNSIKLDDTFIGSLPPFPQKKWFGNTEDEFLKTRQHELEGYFKTIMTSPLCVQIIEKGILRYFLYKEIWKQESEDIKRKCEHIEKWDVMTKKSLISSKNVNNEEEILNYETLGMQMKEEIQKIYSKLEEMKIDLDLLEKNDSFTIIRYEEKRKKLEKELSAQDSLNEIDFKGLLP